MKRLALMLAVIASLVIPASVVANDDHKTTICHVPAGNPGNAHTITIDDNALKAHLGDNPAGLHGGDYLGPCTPEDEPSAPVETESAPVETESAPVETESAPVETESAPVETESTPVETESAPVETESAPVETESTPPTEPPVVGEFSLEVCPNLAAIIAGDTADTLVEVIPTGQSAIRFRALGLLVLLGLNVRIDGQLVALDGNGVITVSPGTHAWSISNTADTEVLAQGDVECPVCNATTTRTDPPNKTLPPTDALGAATPSDGPGSLTLVMLVLAGIAGASLLATSKRR